MSTLLPQYGHIRWVDPAPPPRAWTIFCSWVAIYLPLPQLCSISTLRRLALDDLPDHVGRHAARHVRGEKSSASPPDPRPPAPGAARGARSARAPRSADRPAAFLARRAWPERRPDRSGDSAPASAGPAPGDEVQPSLLGSARPGSSSPATACAYSPTCTLTRLTTRSRSASSHRRCLGRHQHLVEQPPRLADRVSRQLLPILGVSRVAGCGNRYLPRSSPSLSLSLVLDRYSLSLVQPSGADPPRSAGRPHVPPCRAAPTSMTCRSSASRGGALSPPVRLVGRGSPTGSTDRALRSEGPGRRGPQGLSDNTVRKVSVARVMAPRAALVSARALSMTKSWMMAGKRSASTGTPAWRSLSA